MPTSQAMCETVVSVNELEFVQKEFSMNMLSLNINYVIALHSLIKMINDRKRHALNRIKRIVV